MEQPLQRAWLRRGLLAWILWPLSLAYGLLAGLHRSLYRLGIFSTTCVPMPVVVVGNVVAGGAGKTPVVMAIIEYLVAQGLRPGVVSRGHGRRSNDCREATASSLANEVGDEPLLIATRCKVPVFVAARRADAARALLAAHPGTQLIVCDDGLQHHALARDIEIVVFDARGIGNGWLLPAGPLRERWPRPADIVLRTGPPNGVAGIEVGRRLADHAVRADGERIALAALRGKPCVAVAGIATPDAFFAMLRAGGLELHEAVALPDHYDFDSYSRPVEAGYSLICTEKDAVKLWRRHPDAWAVPLLLDIAPAFWNELDRMLASKLSSAHGPETS